MDNLPTEAKGGIDVARRAAKAKLIANLGQLSGDRERLENWLPPVKQYAAALFDGGAEPCCGLFSNLPQFERFLQQELLPWLIEAIMPDRARKVVIGDYQRPERYSVISTGPILRDGVDLEANLPVARGPAGGRLGGAEQRYAVVCDSPHGELELFLCDAGLLYKRFPDELAAVRKTLTAHLRRRAFYWAGRFRPPSEIVPVGSPGAQPTKNKSGRPQGTKVNSAKLRELRDSTVLTQAELAYKCDLSEDVIQRGEAGGRWDSKTFERVAETLSKLLRRLIDQSDLKNLNN
jgi:hypothetical protein